MIDNFKKRFLILSGYDLKKTSKENETIVEQDVKWDLKQKKENEKILGPDVEEKEPIPWKDSCRYPDKAKKPKREVDGVSGEDAMIEGYCVYMAPNMSVEDTMGRGMYFPNEAEIKFFTIDIISNLVDDILKKYPKEDKKELIKQFSKIVPFDSVAYFSTSGVTFTSWFKKNRESQLWGFSGYWTPDTTIKYNPPAWNDPRNAWDKIVDDYFGWIQGISTVIFLIAGFFTEGATWLIWAEIATEGALSAAQMQRDFEKGENISGVFDILFSLTPWLKTTDFFRQIDSEEIRYLFKEMETFGLNKNSTPEDVLEFYNSLQIRDKKNFQRLLDNTDEFSERAMKERFGDIATNLKNHIKVNPSVFKSLSWYKKMASREFGVGAGLTVLNILAEIFFGEQLNDEEKKKFTTITNNAEKVSKELAEEIQYNLIRNAEKIKEVLQSEQIKLYSEVFDETSLDKSAEIIKTLLQDSVSNAIDSVVGPNTYVDLPTDSTVRAIKVDLGGIEDYIKKGYKKDTEITPEEWERVEDTNPIKVNGVFYWKVGEKTDSTNKN